MDDPARELTDLLERARQGCQQAARLLYERYGPAVRHAVRRRLAPSLRRHFDSADFIQSVWGSFFQPFDDATVHTVFEVNNEGGGWRPKHGS
jgi:hypothetical protein